MKIAIIGAGNVGAALGKAWTKRGHEIVFGVRDPESAKARSLAKQFPNAHLLLNGAAVQNAEFIVLATPWQSTEEVNWLRSRGRTMLCDTVPSPTTSLCFQMSEFRG